MQITRYRGDTNADKILITNETTGDAANLTGSTVYLTVSTISNPPDVSTQLYQLTGVVNDPTSGIVEFSPNDVQSDRVGMFYYDIQLVDQSGKKRTIVKDSYQYLQDITKD